MNAFKKCRVLVTQLFVIFFALNSAVSFGGCLNVVENDVLVNNVAENDMAAVDTAEVITPCHNADNSSESSSVKLSKCCAHCLIVDTSITQDKFDDISPSVDFVSHQYKTISKNLSPPFRPPIHVLS